MSVSSIFNSILDRSIAIFLAAFIAAVPDHARAIENLNLEYQTTYKNPLLESSPSNCAPPVDEEQVILPQRAVSLKNLLSSKPGPGSVIPGLTQLHGYVSLKDDLIIYGAREKGQPELFLSDLIVALQKAFGRDFEDTGLLPTEPKTGKGNQRRARTSAISIDPDPAVTERLRAMDRASKGLAQRHQDICAAPQQVVVYNLPRHSRIVKVLVEADYKMKLVNQEHIKLKNNIVLPGTFSEKSSKANIDASIDGRIARTNDRFWFKANKVFFKSDEDTAHISVLQLALDTEKDEIGSLGTEARNDKAERFACAWTAKMSEITKSEPIWRELDDVYRYFALAEVYKNNKDRENGHQRIRDMVLDWDIDKFSVPDTLPGMSRVAELPIKRDGKSYTVVRSVCGGVSLAVRSVRQLAFEGGSFSLDKSPIYKLVRASRPSSDAVAWDVGRFDDVNAELQRAEQIEREREAKEQAERFAQKYRLVELVQPETGRAQADFIAEVGRGEHPQLRDFSAIYYGLPVILIVLGAFLWSRKFRSGKRGDFLPPV